MLEVGDNKLIVKPSYISNTVESASLVDDALDQDNKTSVYCSRSVKWYCLLNGLIENNILDITAFKQQITEDRRIYKELQQEYSALPSHEVFQMTQKVVRADVRRLDMFDTKVEANVNFSESLITQEKLERILMTMEHYAYKKAQRNGFIPSNQNNNQNNHDFHFYKQGMHEILAMISKVLVYDTKQDSTKFHISVKEPFNNMNDNNNNDDDDDEYYFYLYFDLNKFEQDAFTLYRSILRYIAHLYIDSPHCVSIFMSRFKLHDTLLYNRFDNDDIVPELYLFRWLKLLFSREFSTLAQVLLVWDHLFQAFSTVDCIASKIDELLAVLAVVYLTYHRLTLLGSNPSSLLILLTGGLKLHNTMYDDDIINLLEIVDVVYKNKNVLLGSPFIDPVESYHLFLNEYYTRWISYDWMRFMWNSKDIIAKYAAVVARYPRNSSLRNGISYYSVVPMQHHETFFGSNVRENYTKLWNYLKLHNNELLMFLQRKNWPPQTPPAL